MKFSFIPPMSLYPIQFVYNVTQIFLCAYMTIEAGMIAYRNNYTFFMPCNTYNTTLPPTANLLWLFYISKVWDFWDTIFIICNKKWRQLSFLHVYHHTTIFLFYWLNANLNYDGDIYLTILLNGFIHTVMYTYYCTYNPQ
jgi:GNS1/SUR4 family